MLPGPPDPEPPESSWEAIRAAKYRGLLRVCARDLGNRPFDESLRELSDLADACLSAALNCASAETGAEPPALLALGKLGGRELNYSSDVDVLVVYPAADLDAARAVRESNLHIHSEQSGAERLDAWLDLVANAVDGKATLFADDPPDENPAKASEAPVQVANALTEMLDAATEEILIEPIQKQHQLIPWDCVSSEKSVLLHLPNLENNGFVDQQDPCPKGQNPAVHGLLTWGL